MPESNPSTGDTLGPGGPSTVPVDLKLRLAEQRLLVRWQDNHDSVLEAAILRKNCPCATCRTEREEQQKNAASPEGSMSLKILPAGDIRLTGADLVGQYAIRLEWSDGHNSGIFDYRYLRSLDTTGG
ncbi:MAG: DUF971 domain-containing protein [bacterium]|nr:DUF971 domain-containing protein [bacterium]